jgi:hypothetical protein
LDSASVFGTEAPNPQTPCTTTTCGNSAPSACHSLCHFRAEIDPDLAAIADAWATLPDALKSGILAMVKAATVKA